jgi:cephalosporin hydroxylase
MPDGMRFLLEEIAGLELLGIYKVERDVVGIARKIDSSKTKMEQNLNMSLKELIKNNQNESFKSTYFGVPAIKSPADFWIYHEIIFEVKPDVIIEIGTKHGGGTLAYSHLLNNLGNNGRVIGLEIDSNIVDKTVRVQPNITIIDGDACSNFEKVKKLIKDTDKVLIIEDSSHTYENTLNVLNIFSGLVTKGSYFIVEDSNCWHGLDHGPSPGPYEAIETFMKDNNKFEIDSSKERFIITWNPKGYLKRIK